MNFKNIVTNIVGFVFWVVDPSISFITTMTFIGFVLFLFRVKDSIDFVKRFLNKKLEK
jgi:hypothetical protein